MEIKVRKKEEIDRNEWDSLVNESGESTTQLFHSAEIYIIRGFEPLFLSAYENNQLVGGAFIFLKKRFWPLNQVIASAPFAKENRIEILSALVKRLKTEINSMAPLINHVDLTSSFCEKLFLQENFQPREVRTIKVDLSKNIEELLAGVDHSRRKNVNKAGRNGLLVIEGNDNAAWEIFYELYAKTCKRDGIPVTTTREELLVKSKEPNYVLFLVVKDSKKIAGLVVSIFNGRMTHHLTGSLPEYWDYRPNDLLFWHTIEWGKNHGLKEVYLGGIAHDSKPGTRVYGIMEFKKKWGGEEVIFSTFTASKFYYGLIRFLKQIRVIK